MFGKSHIAKLQKELGILSSVPIKKGWSGDEKFCVETTDGERMLLRVSDIAGYEQKKTEYRAMTRAATLGLNTPRPQRFGTCANGKKVYCLSTWLDGEDAASVIVTMTETEKYILGLKSGELLRALHTLSAPSNAEPWEIRFGRRIEERLSQYHKHKGQTKNGELVIKYLNDNAHVLKNRPQTFTHGDFNTTNIIVAPNGEVGVIDFNCPHGDFGDPLWEMICISYMETPDPYYYTGLWNGYTDGTPDTAFFKITAYYFAYDVLSSLGGDDGFDNGDFDNKALGWYDNFNNIVPTWYFGDRVQ